MSVNCFFLIIKEDLDLRLIKKKMFEHEHVRILENEDGYLVSGFRVMRRLHGVLGLWVFVSLKVKSSQAWLRKRVYRR